MPSSEKKVREIVRRHLPGRLQEYGLENWSIILTVKPVEEEGDIAYCVSNLDYTQAEITIDHRKVHSHDDVLEKLRHELFHLLIAEFDLYREYIQKRFDLGDDKAEDRIWNYAMERSVAAIERMHDIALARASGQRGYPRKPEWIETPPETS